MLSKRERSRGRADTPGEMGAVSASQASGFCAYVSFHPYSAATLFTPAATRGARIIPQTPKSRRPAYMAARDRRG